MTATNLDRLITERMRRDNMPGVTVAISDHGRLIFNKGYGFANVEQTITMKPYHRACIGSTSKALAAIGIEKLIQLGALDSLDDTIARSDGMGKLWFWQGFAEGINSNNYTNIGNDVALNLLTNITVRHVLSHTAALS